MRLKDKISVITGAGNGMGAAEANLFAQQGSHVIICDILDDAGVNITQQINKSNGSAEFFHLDVTQEDEWNNLKTHIMQKFGKLDILVNNAGLSGTNGDLSSTDYYDQLNEVNGKSVYLGMKTAISIMVNQNGGSIVNISSMAALVGVDYVHLGYTGSKGAVRMMTKAAAVQYADKSIRINSVHPGMMPPMATAKSLINDPKFFQSVIKTVPMERVGKVEEVANAVLFLASDEASY
ncbi:MAG: SDR family oxidoreductase, partial [SAR202 cluster bacterium]|nr:SDR family oxidoreductase [SAR202 cluster bacterium]